MHIGRTILVYCAKNMTLVLHTGRDPRPECRKCGQRTRTHMHTQNYLLVHLVTDVY